MSFRREEEISFGYVTTTTIGGGTESNYHRMKKRRNWRITCGEEGQCWLSGKKKREMQHFAPFVHWISNHLLKFKIWWRTKQYVHCHRRHLPEEKRSGASLHMSSGGRLWEEEEFKWVRWWWCVWSGGRGTITQQCCCCLLLLSLLVSNNNAEASDFWQRSGNQRNWHNWPCVCVCTLWLLVNARRVSEKGTRL